MNRTIARLLAASAASVALLFTGAATASADDGVHISTDGLINGSVTVGDHGTINIFGLTISGLGISLHIG